MTTSPGFTPALSAGLSLVTSLTMAPLDSLSFRLRAMSSVTAWMDTPSQPRTTFPRSRSWGRISGCSKMRSPPRRANACSAMIRPSERMTSETLPVPPPPSLTVEVPVSSPL